MTNNKTKKKLGKRPNKQTLGIEFRGVSVNSYATENGWKYTLRSRIQKEGVQYHLGCFAADEVVLAAKAYNKGAKTYYTTKVAKKLGMWNVI